MRFILADTGFWIALLDSMDDINKQIAAKGIFSKIKTGNFKILFPSVVYPELLRTKFFKGNKKLKIANLETLLKMEIINRIDDSKYIAQALEITLQEAKRCKKIGFADNIIRLIVKDYHEPIAYLITFDKELIRECQEYVKIYEECYSCT
jgi:rRNA-processing protein FCF1